MANTSLAQQLRKLATPQTNLLVQKKKRASFLFDPSEAASIDRITFYEIGLSGFNELREINEAFEEFRESLFDETSKNFERSIETADVNKNLNRTIKKFLYLASPYFLLKPTQKALEWLIVRFHIHEYNTDELICAALPYHGTRLFARLIQVFDLKNFHQKWQWLLPLQKKGVPLSKIALFNHCASDVTFLKMICQITVDAVKIFEFNASKLTTLFGFYSTTVIGTIQILPKITELHLTHILPSILYGLSTNCVDYCASSFLIIATMLTKTSFQKNLLKKLVEDITQINHVSLQTSLILLLNILYQFEELKNVSFPINAIKNLMKNADWFIPALKNFMFSKTYSNTFYLVLVRDALSLLYKDKNNNNSLLLNFIQNLLHTCRVDEECAEKLIKIIIDKSKKYCDKEWACKLVQNLENQYPSAWDNVMSMLFKEQPSDSLSRILGFTSVTTQIQIFEKLHHSNAVIRIEAIKYIADNPETFKISYLENSLKARWNDEDPEVIKTMFLLPENLRFCSWEIYENLLLRCWMDPKADWNSLLLKIIESLKSNVNWNSNTSKFTVLLLPFLTSCAPVKKSILDVNLPFIKAIKSKIKSGTNAAINAVLKNESVLPTIEELIKVYTELPKENVHLFTLLLLLSGLYEVNKHENKTKILSFVFERMFPVHFKNFKLKHSTIWNENSLEEYYKQTISKFPKAIIFKFLESVIENTSFPAEFSFDGWWDFSNEYLNLISILYKYLDECVQLIDENGCNIFITKFIEKNFNTFSNRINFICNICVIYRKKPLIQISSFKIINLLLKSSEESYAWTLSLKSENVVIPCILIHLYSENLNLRTVVMETVEILSASIGSAFSDEITYAEFLKFLLHFTQEIILDREQLQSKIYMFLSQDPDIQSLLPTSVRFFTKTIQDAVLDCIVNEHTPLSVSASLLLTIEYLKDLVVIQKLIPLGLRILSKHDCPNEDGSFIVCSIIDKLNSNEKDLFEQEDIFKFIDYCLTNSFRIKVHIENNVLCLGTILLQKFAVDIFNALKSDMQKYLLKFVLKIYCGNEHNDLISAVNSFIRRITLNCELIVSFLEDMKNSNIKKSKQESMDTANKSEWLEGIALLELIQNKKKIYNCNSVIPLLFEILQKCCEVDDHIPMEYSKQICLSCILNCSQKLTSEKKNSKMEKLFNVELIVNCIRMSPNPQTHHHALMLLAHCATFVPNQVLHNVMAIFTFMGSTILRQDDSFSFQIISNILETIIPLLVKDDKSEFSYSSICSVLHVFATSILDIPDHRRIPLLLKLMTILCNGKYVHVLLILAMEYCAKSTLNNKIISTKYMEILQELLSLLPIKISLSCFKKLLVCANNLPHNLDDQKNRKFNNELFNLKKCTNKELCHFKYLLLNFISTTLSGNNFIHRIANVNLIELKSFEDDFRGIIEQTLLFVKSVTDYSVSLKNTNTKYWKVMISQALEILNKTNATLTCETFLIVIKDLFNHECFTVQRKSMELLNWRLQLTKDEALKDEFSKKDLILLLPNLMKIALSIFDTLDQDSFDLKLNQQTALISIKLITKYCGSSDHSKKFKTVLSQLSKLLKNSEKINDQVLACLVLCVAELTSSLKVHAIEFLPKLLPNFLSLFERYHQRKEITQNDVILLSMITALQKIIETLPNFLSPYLESILYEITCLTAQMLKYENKDKIDDTKHSTIIHKLKSIRQKIALELPGRVLLPAVSASFATLCENRKFDAIKFLLDILTDSFPKGGQFSNELTALFFIALDFRCTAATCTNEEISLVEKYVLDALCNIILKCSETTFRPFYHKLYDWGIIASKRESKNDRILTYYKALCSISENLKSIFVLFASNIIRNAAELLDKHNISNKKIHEISEDKSVLLIDAILKTLHNVFKYDTVKFLTKDRFNTLVEPLVNQIENTIGDYKERCTEIIIPCISRFAAATTDDSLWKQFNYLILLKTRHSVPEIRLAALETVCSFATHLGDNFLPFLPETVPFLAELLEDENEIVEKETHNAIQRLEQILEEPIKKYF